MQPVVEPTYMDERHVQKQQLDSSKVVTKLLVRNMSTTAKHHQLSIATRTFPSKTQMLNMIVDNEKDKQAYRNSSKPCKT